MFQRTVFFIPSKMTISVWKLAYCWVTQKLPQIYTANHATFPIQKRKKIQYRFAVTSGSPSRWVYPDIFAYNLDSDPANLKKSWSVSAKLSETRIIFFICSEVNKDKRLLSKISRRENCVEFLLVHNTSSISSTTSTTLFHNY